MDTARAECGRGWGTAQLTGCALTALLKAGVDRQLPAVLNAVAWLKAQQNKDGFWGIYPGDPSHSNTGPYPVIGLALATSRTDSSVIAAKHWYASQCVLCAPYAARDWLLLMLEIEPTHSNIPSVASALLSYQEGDGGWKTWYLYNLSDFVITAESLDILGRLGYTGRRIENGILWIENHINSQSVGMPAYKYVEATAWALDALQAANIGDPAHAGAIASGRRTIVSKQINGFWESWIPQTSVHWDHTFATGEALFMLAYMRTPTSEEQTSISAAVSGLSSAQASDGGWQALQEYMGTQVFYTEYALAGLLQAGVSSTSTTVTRGLAYLNARQSVDGGFGDTELTARAGVIYRMAGSGQQGRLQQAVAWIKLNQNPDGGWGSRQGFTSTTSMTSWALIALSMSGESGAEVARGVSWLLAAQNKDKGWGQVMGVPMSADVSTAMAVWALSLAQYATSLDLAVAVEKKYSCAGDVVHVTVTPEPVSAGLVLNGSVSLQEGRYFPLVFGVANGVFAGDFIIPTDALPGTATVHITGSSMDGYGVGTGIFFIKNCASLVPDLAVSESDIVVAFEDPGNPNVKTISVRVRNDGFRDATNVVVTMYAGAMTPDNMIGTELVPTIPASDNRTIKSSVQLAEDNLISVVVDPDNVIGELDESNNAASILITRLLADLSLSPSDLAVLPPCVEGQAVPVTALIRNAGTSGAADVEVSFYDGDPAAGGTLIGTSVVPYLEAGATALSQVAWNTFGQSGRNYVHVLVDPLNQIAESNENNNASLVAIDIPAPVKPDLAIASSDLSFSSLNPAEGDALVLHATVHNLGQAVAEYQIALYDGNPGAGGSLLANRTVLPVIPFGGTAVVDFSIATLGFAGDHKLYVSLDPAHSIDEVNEQNNLAWASISIGPANLSLAVTTDKGAYGAQEDLQATVSLENNLGISRSGTLEVKIVDAAGASVAAVGSQNVALGPGEQKTLNFTWNTAATLSGGYRVYSHLLEAGKRVARSETAIAILPSTAISQSLTTDRTSYSPNQRVILSSRVSSLSPNFIFEELTATIAIASPHGEMLNQETTVIPILMPGQFLAFKTYWNTSTHAPGAYPATVTVADAAGAVLSTATVAIMISEQIQPSRNLQGQIAVGKKSILQGEPVTVSYSLTNVGNVDLADISLSIPIVHTVTLAAHDTLADQTVLNKGAVYANAQQLNTGPYTAKDYLVVLRAGINGIEETLASTYFRVEGAPSQPSLHAPQHGAVVETLQPVLSVNNASDPNDDILSYEFELFADIGLANRIGHASGVSEGMATTSWQVPFDLTENAVYFWRVRAFDGRLYGAWMTPAAFRVNVTNDPPSAPTPSSPAHGASVDEITPLLTVDNAFDPDSFNLTYNFVLALDPNFSQQVAAVTGIFESPTATSWQVPVALADNTWYYWKAQADDWLDVGPWTEPVSFFVNTTNDAPTAPVILSPASGEEVPALSAVITAENSTDPDSVVITYLFEIDSSPSFDSPALRSSGYLPSGPAATAWLADGLSDNAMYFVRVKASDGQAESVWSETAWFFVNTRNDPPTVPVLENPSNGGAVHDFNPRLTIRNSTDQDHDILSYEFELYDDAAMTLMVASAGTVIETAQTTSWTVPMALSENMTYYWRARAFDGELLSGWMPRASFMVNTANDAPGAPSLAQPADGASVSTLTPSLAVHNAVDPDSDLLTYDFEVYKGGMLTASVKGIAGSQTGITAWTPVSPLADNAAYTWRARAFDGDRYGPWMDMAGFTVHLPATTMTGTIDFDPNTLNRKSRGTWVTVYIELPAGYSVTDIAIGTLRLNGTVPAESWPYALGDYDKDGIADLMVKFNRDAVIGILPNGDSVPVTITGKVGSVTFEGVDLIRVIP